MPKFTNSAPRVALIISVATFGTATIMGSASSGQGNMGQASPGMTAQNAAAAAQADLEQAITVVTTLPPGYRDWKFVSAAHEAGELNDIRVVIANDKAINAYRAGKPFPEGSIVGRVAWKMVPSEANNKIFGQPQSFVPGDAPEWYLQFMEKDSKKYAATGGWGYSNFGKDLKPTTDKKVMYSCFACHKAIAGRDYIFTDYAH